MNTRLSRGAAIAAGLALILLPVAAVVLKLAVFPGWMMIIAIWSSPLLLIGYALQIVIAGNGFLRERGVFRRSPHGARAAIAAWLTSVGIFAVAFFLVDGGDDGTYGSAFTQLLGTSSTGEGEQVSMVLCLIAAFVWLLGWLWLLLEWVVQLVQLRRADRDTAAPA